MLRHNACPFTFPPLQIVLFLATMLFAMTARFLHQMGLTRITLSFGVVSVAGTHERKLCRSALQGSASSHACGRAGAAEQTWPSSMIDRVSFPSNTHPCLHVPITYLLNTDRLCLFYLLLSTHTPCVICQTLFDLSQQLLQPWQCYGR